MQSDPNINLPNPNPEPQQPARINYTAVDFGSMGLAGAARVLGNASAMLAITLFLFMLYRDWMVSVRTEQDFQRQTLTRQLDRMQTDAQTYNDKLTTALRALETKMELFISEMRASRLTVEKATTAIQTAKPPENKDDKPE